MKTFGDNLKYYRNLNKISQKALAFRLETTQQRVSEWECDKVEPSLYNIIRILRVFDISFAELTDGLDIK